MVYYEIQVEFIKTNMNDILVVVLEHNKWRELFMNKNENRVQMIYSYDLLYRKIDKLGSEIKLRNYKTLMGILIVAILCLVSFVGVYLYGIWSFYTSKNILPFVISGILACAFVALVLISGHVRKIDKYVKRRANDASKRMTYIEYVLRMFFAYHHEFPEKLKKESCAEGFITKLNNRLEQGVDKALSDDIDEKEAKQIEEIARDITDKPGSLEEIDYLTVKFSDELKSLNEKRREGVAISLIVALLGSGMEFVKNVFATILWSQLEEYATEYVKAFVAMGASSLAFIIFAFIIYFAADAKSTARFGYGVKIRNVEYTVFVLKDYKKELIQNANGLNVKDQNSNYGNNMPLDQKLSAFQKNTTNDICTVLSGVRDELAGINRNIGEIASSGIFHTRIDERDNDIAK